MKNFLNSDRLKWFGVSRMIGTVLSVAFVGIAGWWLVQVPPPPPEANLSFASTTVAASPTIGVSASSINTTPQIITVHVAGAVKNPGVYRLKYGSRINDGIVAAGGATSAANLDVINLATVLNEGEQIYVPKRGEKPHVITNRPQVGGAGGVAGAGGAGGVAGAGGAANSAVPQLININLASVVELEQLPGVGPATAKAIVAYREKNGAFLKVEDLLKVRGIGPAKLSEILPRARVN
ncbi:MAG: helix-hairpin-helix domain-containing protein [Actinomycetota bacterium]|nr:helix-hairpin-helix domain-containing protein [Actinomycetota bacterium]